MIVTSNSGVQSSGLIIFAKVAGLGNPKKVEFQAGGIKFSPIMIQLSLKLLDV